MPKNQFITNPIDDIFKTEQFLFGTYFGVKNDVKKDITQLLLNAFPVFIGDHICQFMTFFNGQLSKGMDGLLSIPGALLTQFIHYFLQPFNGMITHCF